MTCERTAKPWKNLLQLHPSLNRSCRGRPSWPPFSYRFLFWCEFLFWQVTREGSRKRLRRLLPSYPSLRLSCGGNPSQLPTGRFGNPWRRQKIFWQRSIPPLPSQRKCRQKQFSQNHPRSPFGFYGSYTMLVRTATAFAGTESCASESSPATKYSGEPQRWQAWL